MTLDWWTLGLQTVNVAILIWLLQRFFWRPVAAIIEARRLSVETALADAKTVKAKADAAAVDIATTRAGFAKEREALLATAHAEAEQARKALLEQAAKDAASIQAKAQADSAKQRKASEAEWSAQAADLAVDIARRLAARLRGTAAQDCFADWLITALAALPPAEHPAGSLELTSARALDAAEQQRLATGIAKALGRQSELTFKTDPALIAGLELRGPHLRITNSWRDDLAKIREDLSHDA